MDQTLSRRSASRTGTIAAIAASLLGTPTTTTVAAEPPVPTPALATVANADDLAAECKRLADALHAAASACCDEQDRLKAAISPDAYRPAIDYVEGIESRRHELWLDLVVAELIRHLPGM